METEVVSKSTFSMSLLPLARGRRWPTGRMRGLTWSESDEPENSGFFPLTLALSPRGKRIQLENQLRGGEGTIARKSTASFLTA